MNLKEKLCVSLCSASGIVFQSPLFGVICFLEMPLSSQALYMHLNMSAADDGL